MRHAGSWYSFRMRILPAVLVFACALAISLGISLGAAGSASASTGVQYGIQDGIAVITMDSPPVNAFTDALHDDFRSALATLAGRAVRVAIVTGTGKYFQAGGDMNRFVGDGDDHPRRLRRGA